MAQVTDMARLPEKVQALPPELYTIILDYAFAAPNNTTITIDKSYRPPNQLQIIRALRDDFARAYYGSTIFRVESREGLRTFRSFVLSLSEKHQEYIKTVRLVRQNPRDPCTASWEHSDYMQRFLTANTGLRNGQMEASAIATYAYSALMYAFPLDRMAVNVIREQEEWDEIRKVVKVKEIEEWVTLDVL